MLRSFSRAYFFGMGKNVTFLVFGNLFTHYAALGTFLESIIDTKDIISTG